ncbi:MAG: L,D-transpeptidase [Marmoricola sp.]
MHVNVRRVRGAAAVVAALVALVIALPASTSSASTVWGGTTPRWVVRACRTPAKAICIDKTTRKLVYMRNGHVALMMDARFGAPSTPTREGTFKVYYKDADHVSSLYGSKMPYSMFFSGGEAIHYSIDFATYGYAHASHGCVNIRDYNGIKWLYSQIPVGTKVVVYH